MTSAAAAKFKLDGRGVVKPGACADLVVFDPAAIADKATWKDPHHYPTGVLHVLVNGRPVIAEGRHTGAAPGRVLRKTGRRMRRRRIRAAVAIAALLAVFVRRLASGPGEGSRSRDLDSGAGGNSRHSGLPLPAAGRSPAGRP